ncbi:MAG TPA: fluoride efflux transporter CrcB [Baekduia sp.]|uniref:fluoride efflux transporter CrcB n=1 Tax=Baekduia sp. TaxID=2600305 RepID=UPI002D76EE32|nr:fluoride efflux transporter CrcB [Baekduia sp.]HET6505837.1 fluoride efflux transporter CrcB [Baekduia sp.]
MSAGTWVALTLAGGLGAVARALMTHAVNTHVGRSYPFGTLAVNLSGAFALGLLSAAGLSAAALAICGTGFMGGYTTFSTWMYETRRATRSYAVANVVASAMLGVLAVWLGRTIA